MRIIRSAEADVRIGFNERLPELLERSLLPEAERPTSERSSVSISVKVKDQNIIVENPRENNLLNPKEYH